MNSKSGTTNQFAITTNESWKTAMAYQENDEEELQYGPGIVNKLKSRYLSRTLREKAAGEPRRPALRRATSLENWLDKDGSHSGILSPHKIISDAKSDARRPRPLSFNVTGPALETKAPTPTAVRNYFFDVNSPSDVSPSAPTPPSRKTSLNGDPVPSPLAKEEQATFHPSTPTYSKKPDHLLISKDAIIIVDKGSAGKPEPRASPVVESKPVFSPTTTAPPPPPPTTTSGAHKTRRSLPTNTRYNVEDAELPAPDTVRQVKRIFEAGCARKPSSRRSQSAGPGLNRVPLPAEHEPTNQRNARRVNAAIPNGKPLVVPNRKVSAPRANSIALDDKPVIISKPSGLSPKPPPLTPKPANIPNKRPQRTSLPDGLMANSSRGARNSVSAIPSTPTIPSVPAAPVTLVTPTLAVPVANNVESVEVKILPIREESVDQTDYKGSKTVSRTALDNIRKESVSVNFRFDGKKEEKVPALAPVTHSKQIGIIRPQVKAGAAKVDDPASKTSTSRNNATNATKGVEGANSSTVPASKSQVQPASASSPTVSLTATTVVLAETAKVTPIPARSDHAKADAISNKPVEISKKTAQVVNGKLDNSSSEGRHVPSIPNDAINSYVASASLAAPTSEGSKEIVPTTGTAPQPASKGAPLRNPSKSWHNEATTTVFNFVNSPKKIDHIRNEGGHTTIHLYKPNDSGITKLPDFDGGESSDFIDDMDILKRPPSPCNVHFEGANIIHKKSVLQRRSRPVKLNIRFNDDMTRLFEYPSEASLLEDNDSPVKLGRNEDYQTPQEPSEKVSSGGLSSYTPSKVLIENTFKLGISSSVSVGNAPELYTNSDSVTTNNADAEYLRPSEEGTTWSSETTSDLLF